jgi:hypothetical protein
VTRCLVRTRSFGSRLALILGCALTAFTANALAATVPDFGGHVVTGVSSNHCLFSGNLCTIRSARVQLNVAIAWALGSHTTDVVFQRNAVEFQDSSGNPNGLIQIGYAKVGTTAVIDNCGRDGGSRAIITEWDPPGTGNYQCYWGQNVTAGESHLLKVGRCCADGHWGTFVDSNITSSGGIYLGPDTTGRVLTGGETAVAETDATMDAHFGGSGADNWQISSSGDSDPSPTWFSITENEACLYDNNGHYSVGAVTVGSTWLIHKAAGQPTHIC